MSKQKHTYNRLSIAHDGNEFLTGITDQELYDSLQKFGEVLAGDPHDPTQYVMIRLKNGQTTVEPDNFWNKK